MITPEQIQSKSIELSRSRFETLESLMIQRAKLQREFDVATKLLDAKITAERCALAVALELTKTH